MEQTRLLNMNSQNLGPVGETVDLLMVGMSQNNTDNSFVAVFCPLFMIQIHISLEYLKLFIWDPFIAVNKLLIIYSLFLHGTRALN